MHFLTLFFSSIEQKKTKKNHVIYQRGPPPQQLNSYKKKKKTSNLSTCKIKPKKHFWFSIIPLQRNKTYETTTKNRLPVPNKDYSKTKVDNGAKK